MTQDDLDKIERYINGETSDSEKKNAESLFLDGENNLYFSNCLNKYCEFMLKGDSSSRVNLSHLLDRIQHIIRKNETLKRQKPLQSLIRVYMRSAAILLIPLLLAGGLIFNNISPRNQIVTDHEAISNIYAPMGSRVSFDLPDGTTGMLNSGSHLSYSLPFADNRRIILEGEAWFEVNHDEDHPFEITIGNSKVKVLGTSFNLNAYPAENYVELVLLNSKVEFSERGKSEEVTIRPSERLIFHDGNITKSVTDAAKYNAWTEGKFVFRGDSMAEVACRIERWYNVKVIIADIELEKYPFHATFQDDSLENVMRLLSMTSPINFKISPRTLMLDGTYKKEEVTML